MDREQLERAIASLEGQRAELGAEVVDLALAPLRARLAALARPAPSAADLRGERKFITVMFADVAGFTAFSESLDPEAVRDLMNDCFDLLVPVIEKYQGTLDKFIGDGVMALFGAPVTHENDAERALRAALEMSAALDDFNAARGTDLGLHFGINTGTVVAGGLGIAGRQEYSVMGDGVNVASRLEAISQRGEIIVGPETYRLTMPLFEFDVLPPIELKGKARPVAAYRLRGVKRAPGSVRGIVGMESPLVGRAVEFEALQHAITTLQSGQGGLVTLVGEAGLGKSRLMAEIRRAAPGSVTWVEGRSLSYGSSIAYLPLLYALRGILGVALDAPPETVRAALLARLAAVCGEQARRLYPYLGRLLSLPLEEAATAKLKGLNSEALKSATFQAVETFVRQSARAAPLVIVGEDMHWADPTSLALWERLMPLVVKTPLLLIAVMRPELEHGCWHIRELAAQRYAAHHTYLWLEPLSASDSESLIGNLLHVEHLPPDLREKIQQNAEGNPFYVEEIIRSLMDSGAIAYNESTTLWQATRQVDEIELPDTLQGVLMSRIDRLQFETKRVLQLAAVIGRSFLYRVLAEIAHTEQALDARLLTLVEQQMIRERTRLPELEYIFKHQLTQEAAYNGLLKKERREFHRQVGEAVERLFPDRADELVGLLAYHWEQAGEHAKAIPCLTRAGQLAAAQFANTEAINYYQRALALLPAEHHLPRYNLLIACDIVYDLMADRTDQLQGLKQLAALAEAADNDSWRSQVAQRWANYHCGTSDFAAAQEQAQTAVRLGEAAQNLDSQAAGYFVWGRALRMEQRFEAARQRLEQGLAVARAAGDRSLEGSILRNIGNVLYFQKDLLGGKACIEQALQIHRQIGDRSNEAAELNSLGLICTELGDPEANRAHLEQALAIYREIGDRYGQGMVFSNLGDYYRGQYQYDQAKECYEQGLASWKQAGYQIGEASILNNLGWLDYWEGNYAAARTDFEQGLAIAQAANNLARCAEAYGGLGRVAESQADLMRARRDFEKALALDQELGDFSNIFLEQANLALISRRLGELETAGRAFTELLSQCRQESKADLRDFEWLCLQALADVAQLQGNYTVAQAHSRRALELAQEKNDRLNQGTALIGLGHALAALQDGAGAANAYQNALALLRGLSARQRRQPDALAGLAALALARQELPQALAYVAEIQPFLAAGPLEGAGEPMWVYLTCYRVLQAAGDPGAVTLLRTAYELLQGRAAALETKAQRRTFLKNIPAHREILAAWSSIAGN